jgi:hypothetical protein
MVQTCLNLDEESKRKRPRINDGTYDYIKNKAQKLNDTGSKSVLVHEIVLMTTEDRDEFDDIDKLEDRVNSELSRITSPSFLREIEKTKISGDSRSTQTAETRTRLNLQLLPSLVDDVLPSHGRNTVIMDKVDEYFNSAFQSRSHRIEIKENLIAYIESGEQPSSDIAKAIVSGDTTDYEVGDVHQKLQKYTDDIDLSEIDDAGEFKNIVDELKKAQQYEALIHLIKNTHNITYGSVDRLVENEIGVTTEEYREEKIKELIEKNDLDVGGYGNEDEHKTEIDEFIEENSMKDAIVRYLNGVDEEYMKEFDVAERISNITSDDYSEMDVLNNIDEYQESGFGYIVETDEDGIRYLKSPHN